MILVASHSLENLGGSETFTFTVIEELVRLGYHVEYFTFKKGLVSNKIEEELGVNFFTWRKCDLILANHFTCVEKLFRFGFIIQTCHGIYPDLERPSEFANAYVSISNEVYHYILEIGFKSNIIYNGVNLSRFKSTAPIGSSLKNILSLCQSETANKRLEEICIHNGYNFKSINKYKESVWSIEKVINQFDLVIGLGRSAIEAMACGRPIVVFDERDYFEGFADGYILNRFEESLRCNFSGRSRRLILNNIDLLSEIQMYNYSDGDFYRKKSLELFDVKESVKKYLDIKRKWYLYPRFSIPFILTILKLDFFSRIYFSLRFRKFRIKSWY